MVGNAHSCQKREYLFETQAFRIQGPQAPPRMKPERKTLLKLKLAKACFSFRGGHFFEEVRKPRKLTHIPRENALPGGRPFQNPGAKIGRPLPRVQNWDPPGVGKIVKIALGRFWGALGSLLGFFCRGLLLLSASWGASGFRQASGSDLGMILEPFGSQIR